VTSEGRITDRRTAKGECVKPFVPKLIFVLVLCTLTAGAAAYDYPLRDPYLATIIGTPEEFQPQLPEKIDYELLNLQVFPGRTPPDVFWYQRDFRYSLTFQKGEAPLIFVIAGTGGAFHSSNMVFFQKLFFQAGFHVICLSSPTHMNFIVTASETGVPGDTVGDARDLYRVMTLVWEQIRDRIRVSEFHLTGYSLGATQSAFVAKLDAEQLVFKFKKVCLINPAVSLFTSAGILDAMLLRALPGGMDTFDDWFQQIFRKFSEIYKIMGQQDLTHDFLYEAYKAFYLKDPPKQENMAGMIGTAFRFSAINMAFTADVMTDFGWIKPKNLVLGPADSLTGYYKVSSRTSFIDYFDEFFFPYFQSKQPGVTRPALIERLSLRSIATYLRTTPNIMLMGNADDLILAPEDLVFLKEVFGARATIYPIGGHCGNMRFKENTDRLVHLFTN
jgi:pimeloyl-ACP methyl ester carboxylesterase